jgi:hypothetical protein
VRVRRRLHVLGDEVPRVGDRTARQVLRRPGVDFMKQFQPKFTEKSGKYNCLECAFVVFQLVGFFN